MIVLLLALLSLCLYFALQIVDHIAAADLNFTYNVLNLFVTGLRSARFDAQTIEKILADPIFDPCRANVARAQTWGPARLFIQSQQFDTATFLGQLEWLADSLCLRDTVGQEVWTGRGYVNYELLTCRVPLFRFNTYPNLRRLYQMVEHKVKEGQR